MPQHHGQGGCHVLLELVDWGDRQQAHLSQRTNGIGKPS
ncbi:hypothetical protein BF49_2542 [Bradyrhizobium sp.]|nr:hypothetical protein BF49_2542 [Bradyrhizobium sp.]